MSRELTRSDMDHLTAFLGGYLEEGAITAVALDEVVASLRSLAPDATIDGMVASRILRRNGFQRSYLPADAGAITYRKVD